MKTMQAATVWERIEGVDRDTVGVEASRKREIMSVLHWRSHRINYVTPVAGCRMRDLAGAVIKPEE